MRLLNGLVCLLVLAMLLAGSYYSYDTQEARLTEKTRMLHGVIGHGFADTLWKSHRYKIMPLLASGRMNLSDEIDVAVLASDITGYLAASGLDSVQLYGSGRQLVAAMTLASGQSLQEIPATLFANALATKTAVAAPIHQGFWDLKVQTAVPIVRDGQVELVMMLVSDVSAEMKAFVQQLGLLLAGIVMLLILVVVVARLNIHRVENVIARQFEENTLLASQATLAKEENMQKSQFLANITHELRTPLNAIIGFSDILKNEFVPAPGQSNHTNYINDIHSAGTHLLSLINDILDYSKAEAGKLELEVTEVNAIKMIQNCMRLVQPRAEIAQVRVLESLPKEQMIITTDGKKFKQILLNLLSNAVKFTPPNGTVKVSAWLDLRDDAWMFEVRDSGIGIAPKDISRAMAPFGQVDNALSRKFEGTGLGLPLTKKFVELMGGKFTIDSELNKGTTVTFSIPRECKPQEGVVVKQVA